MHTLTHVLNQKHLVTVISHCQQLSVTVWNALHGLLHAVCTNVLSDSANRVKQPHYTEGVTVQFPQTQTG